ncbi:MAG TPA: hypothetical protein VF534_29530 [Paraburkholderia sp.]
MTKINGPLAGGTSASSEASAGGAGVAVIKPAKAASGGVVDALQDVKTQRAGSSFRTSSAKAKLTQAAQALSGAGQKPVLSNGPRAGYVPPGAPFQGPEADRLQRQQMRQQQRQDRMGMIQELNYGLFHMLEKDAEGIASVMTKAAEATLEASRKV